MNNKVLMLGDLNSESVINEIRKFGYEYTRKIFQSSLQNWKEIHKMISHKGIRDEEYTHKHVIVKITESILFKLTDPEYMKLFRDMCKDLSQRNHIIFIYNRNLLKEFSLANEAGYDEKVKGAEEVVDFLNTSGLNISPYNNRMDIHFGIQNYFDEIEEGFIFRFYITDDRIWANEAEKMLDLFRDYLKRISGLPIKCEELKTTKGTIYSYYCTDEDVDLIAINDKFSEFVNFLNVSIVEPNSLIDLMKNSNVPEHKLRELINKYSREAKRLLIDIEYDKKEKMLSIQRALHTEFLEVEISKNDVCSLVERELKNNNIPFIDSITKNNVTQITINNPQIIQHAEGIIAREISGGIIYSENDKELIKLFERFLDNYSAKQLKTDLDILKDDSAPDKVRQISWKSIQAFLFKHSKDIGKVGVSLLEKYIESKLFGQ